MLTKGGRSLEFRISFLFKNVVALGDDETSKKNVLRRFHHKKSPEEALRAMMPEYSEHNATNFVMDGKGRYEIFIDFDII